MIRASFIGTVIEWYAFFPYGTAALVFGQLFIPVSTPLISALSLMDAFAVGFLARSVG